MGPFSQLLGSGLTLGHSSLVIAGYAVLFGLLLFWVFRRRDVD